MAVLTVQRGALTGAALTMAAAAGGGDAFANDGNTVYRISNAGVGSINVTFDSPNTCDFALAANAAHDLVVAVTNGTMVEIGPFNQGRFNDVNSRVQVSYSGVTSVTVAAISR